MDTIQKHEPPTDVVGYKVVLVNRTGRRYSAIMDGVARVNYVPHRAATPRPGCGPLAVYTEEAAARNTIFIHRKHPRARALNGPTSYQLWECRYTPATVEFAWYSPEYGTHIPNARYVALATSVTLVRRIK